MPAESVVQSQSRITVTLDGVNLGVWDTRTGGATDTNSVQYFMGGGGPRRSLGGQQQVDNVVCQVLNTPFIQAQTKWIVSRCGKGTLTVTDQPLDAENNAYGDPYVWSGRLKRCLPPESNNANNAAKLVEIEAEVDGSMG